MVGKVVRRRKDGFSGIIKEVVMEKNSEPCLRIYVTAGKGAGGDVEFQLAFVIGHPEVYTVSDE